MSTVKRNCKVVMIEVSGNSVRPLLFNPSSGKMELPKHEYGYSAKDYKDVGYKTYQLYFVNHDEIKIGDYYLNNVVPSNKRITLSKGLDSKAYYDSEYVMKVVATTDSLFHLPKPTQKFVSKFISEYNKGNIIDEVNIDFIFENLHTIANKAKVNGNNEIKISKVKDSWNRDEIFELVRKFSSYKTHSFTSEDINWVKNNL